MLNYKLVLELKDAGFPMDNQVEYARENSREEGLGSCCYCGSPTLGARNDAVSIPTLSELISACGDGFGQLGAATKGFNVWQLGIRYPVAFGKTPEIAVARLWLELNKKNNKHIKSGKVIAGRLTLTLDGGIATIRGDEEIFKLNAKEGEVVSLHNMLGSLIEMFPEDVKYNKLGERLA